MTRIRLSSSGSIICTDMGVVLHSDVGTLGLEGDDVKLFVDTLLPLLDGNQEREDIVNAVSEDLHSHVSTFLYLLERQGLLEEVSDEMDNLPQARWNGQQRFFRAWANRPEEASHRLREASVLIVGLEPWGVVTASELAAAGVGALHLLGDGNITPEDLLSVRLWDPGLYGRPRGQALAEILEVSAPWCKVTTSSSTLAEDIALVLAQRQWNLVIGTMAPDDIVQHLQLACNAHKANLLSLFGSLQGLEAFVGPVVIPGKTPCWNCCRLRLLANSNQPWAAHAVQQMLLARRAPVRRWTGLAPMAPLLGHLLALEALKLISGYGRSSLLGRLMIQNMVTHETTLHTVIPMPWCTVCGGASTIRQGLGEPGLLADNDTLEGLLQSLKGWVDSRTGVISHVMLRNQDNLVTELPICASAFLGAYTEGIDRPTMRQSGGGKGLTPAEAMVGAIGEAIERYSASRCNLDELCCSPMPALEGDILDPRQLCLYDEAQYSRPGFPFVRFEPDSTHMWIQGRWIDTGESVWVPALPTFFELPQGVDDPFCQVTTNGLAAGSDLESASLRATFELVERDAFMLTWLCRRPGRKLAVDDALEPGVHEILQQLQECGAKIELYLLDVGLSIPTVICLGLGDGRLWPGVTLSSAAHISPRIAARKAILEQGFSGVFLRRLMIGGEHQVPERPEQIRTVLDHALFYLSAARATACNFLRSDDQPPLSLAMLQEPADVSLEACARRISAGGIRIAIVDVTAPDVALGPFRVVRALGTNLQPPHFGFGLERLANPRLRSLLAGELNSAPHPLC